MRQRFQELDLSNRSNGELSRVHNLAPGTREGETLDLRPLSHDA